MYIFKSKFVNVHAYAYNELYKIMNKERKLILVKSYVA